MSKTLVAYFSVSGVTRRIAEDLAMLERADLFEIKPQTPYTPADLDWKDKQSRSSLEMQDLNCRPKMSDMVSDMEKYEKVFLGFPIWWEREPSIVDTFLDLHDFSGKKIIPFCTSGGSGIGETAKRLRELAGEKAVVKEGARLGGDVSEEDLKIWTQGLNV